MDAVSFVPIDLAQWWEKVQRWIYHVSILPKYSHLFRHLWIEPFFTIIQIIPKSIMDNMDNLGSTIIISWGYPHYPQLIFTAINICQIFAMEHPTNPPRLGGADPAQSMVILVRMTQYGKVLDVAAWATLTIWWYVVNIVIYYNLYCHIVDWALKVTTHSHFPAVTSNENPITSVRVVDQGVHWQWHVGAAESAGTLMLCAGGPRLGSYSGLALGMFVSRGLSKVIWRHWSLEDGMGSGEMGHD